MKLKNNIFKDFFTGFLDLIKTIATVFIIAFLIKTFVIQTYIIDGQSMEKNFHNGEYLLVDKLTYRFSSPKRGDVVVFVPHKDSTRNYIKRIIGLPGEKVKITKDSVYVNGNRLDESEFQKLHYVNSNLDEDEIYSINLGEGQYVVLGDNRTNSKDSRSIGPMYDYEIVGRAFVTIYPFKDFGLVTLPKF